MVRRTMEKASSYVIGQLTAACTVGAEDCVEGYGESDPSTLRSRSKKNASSRENLESTSAGRGTSEGKRALYHCNYCNKDITGKIRIKCAVCPDFDLCVDYFSVGAEVTPHKSNHPYRVMDNLSVALFIPDWNADEEMLLLEGIDMYGFNWAEVAEHVGTKGKDEMSHVCGKNRKEIVAEGHIEERKGSFVCGELDLKEESLFSPSRVKVEETHKADISGCLLSSSNTDPQIDRCYGGKKPSSSGNERSCWLI